MNGWQERFDGKLEVTGSRADARDPFSPEQLAQVPAKRGVLLLLSEDLQPVTLISAADMRSRLRNRLTAPESDQRTRTADLRRVTRCILWKLAYSHFETDLHYLELSRAIWPDRYAQFLAWKPAWFVCAMTQDPAPRFVRRRGADTRQPGEFFGPFQTGKHADRFVEILQDAFDLCRHHRCLMQAPNASPCPYAQMGRCLSPCDGTISMDIYRRRVQQAASYAAGQRSEFQKELTGQMHRAARELEFENAAAIKKKLKRLSELDAQTFERVGRIEEFQYILIQPGSGVHQARVFFADRGSIHDLGTLEYPLAEGVAEKTLARVQTLRDGSGPADDMEQLRVGLTSRYLYTASEKQGLILHLDESLTAARLAERISESKERLKLREKPQRKGKQDASSENDTKNARADDSQS